MRPIYLALIASAALSSPALAQNAPTYLGTTGQRQDAQGVVCLNPTTGALESCSGSGGSGASAPQVQGTSASGSAPAGNSVAIGCVFNTSPPTVTNGQRTDCQSDANGNLRSLLINGTVTGTDNVPNTLVGVITNATQNSALRLFPMAMHGFDGTAWDAFRTIQGADGTGNGIQAVTGAPCSAATCGIVSVRSPAVASSLVLKASPGTLYDWQVTSGASAGYVLLMNATTAPAAGAVTPVQCVAVAANTTVGSSFNIVPEYYSAGVTILFSTTGCYSYTVSATAFLRGRVQ